MQNEIEILQMVLAEQDAVKKQKLFEQMVQYITQLLHNNFDGLVNILYRVDVDEKKLKQLLKTEPQQDAAYIITNLLIERQQQKMNLGKNLDSNSIPKDEKW